MQNLGQTSASNISSALSSIMTEMNKNTPNTHINPNITVNANNANTNISNPSAQGTSSKGVPAYSSNQQPKGYSNLGAHAYGENYYSSTQYGNAKSPKNITTGSKPILFKAPEEKDRIEPSYHSTDKKRTEPDLYPKKFTPSGQTTSSHTGIHAGPSSKYAAPNYQYTSCKVTSHESSSKHATGYQGLNKNIEGSTSSNLNKGIGSKYGILNLGLNKPGGMFKGKE